MDKSHHCIVQIAEERVKKKDNHRLLSIKVLMCQHINGISHSHKIITVKLEK